MKKTEKVFKKWKVLISEADAATPDGTDQSQMTDDQAQPNSQAGQTSNTEKLAPSAEVMLIRDLLKALVINVPSDSEIIDLVNTEVPDKLPKKLAEEVHNQVIGIIQNYSNYEDNATRLKNIDKVIINESNYRKIYKDILTIIEKYTNSK